MNKYQEALDTLEYLAVQYENTKTGEHWDEVADKIQSYKKTLQELVDKYTPIKPVNYDSWIDEYGMLAEMGDCPHCNSTVTASYARVTHCESCGQAILWGWIRWLNKRRSLNKSCLRRFIRATNLYAETVAMFKPILYTQKRLCLICYQLWLITWRKTYMMPTDEKLIEILRKIKEHCENIEMCQKTCPFWTEQRCQISMLAESLNTVPCGLEMEETERIIHL